MSSFRGVVVLTGPKGSGKTHVGMLLERELGLPFLRVEPVFLAMRDGRDPLDEAYLEEGFTRVEGLLRERYEADGRVVFETTGAAPRSHRLIASIREWGRVVVIGLDVPEDVCLDRIRDRDPGAHIPVSDDLIAETNAAARRRPIPPDLIIENVGLADEEIVHRIADALGYTG